MDYSTILLLLPLLCCVQLHHTGLLNSRLVGKDPSTDRIILLLSAADCYETGFVIHCPLVEVIPPGQVAVAGT
jgi:hypothetical protein